MQELNIPNGYFQLWQMYLLQHNIDYQRIPELSIHFAAIQQVLASPLDGQSSYRLFTQAMQISQQVLQCPQLPFEVAKLVRPEHFGVVGYMASRSASVADALQHVLRFSRLVIDGQDVMPLSFLDHGQSIELNWPLHDAKYSLINELTMACMVHLAWQIFPAQQFHLLEVGYAHSPQMAQYHYQKFFDCPIYFKQQRYRLLMDSESLGLKSALADPSLMQLLLKQAEEAIATKPKADDVMQRIRQFINEYLRQYAQAPKIEQLAEQLFMSKRSVQRYLSEHSTTFKQLLEHERMKRCEQLLIDDIALFDIAIQLGYSDQSALARAYKAYTGQTLLVRKRQLKI